MPDGAGEVGTELLVPEWEKLFRIFPISVWSLGTLILGLYIGWRACQPFIEFLKEQVRIRRNGD